MSEDGLPLLSTAHPAPKGIRARARSLLGILRARYRIWRGTDLEMIEISITHRRNPMIEKAAKAIREKCVEIEHQNGILDADPMWVSKEYARAVLAAIREPSEEMVRSGLAEVVHSDFRPATTRAKAVYQAMIDKILEEK